MQICNRAIQKRDMITRYERHHIYPKSFGGTHKDKAYLTCREHFLVHWLLTKFTTRRARMKMAYALTIFQAKTDKHNRAISGWQYERIRLERGMCKPTEEAREKISKALKGRILPPFSDEHKANISKARKGFKHSEETKEKLRGHKHSEETRKKISENSKRLRGPRGSSYSRSSVHRLKKRGVL